MPTREDVQRDFEPHYLFDYVTFSGVLRHYTAKSLEDLLRADPNGVHSRFFIVGLYKEQFAAYEDIGAILYALLQVQKGNHKTVLRGILEYSPQSVMLSNLFEKNKIKSADELYSALGLEQLIPTDWPYRRLVVEKALRRMCRFVFIDCQDAQNRVGVYAYNQIKHNLAFVPNGRRYSADLPDAPAVLVPNSNPLPNPYILVGIPMSPDKWEARAKIVEFVQSTLRGMVAFYLLRHHGDFLRASRRLDPPHKLFEIPQMIGVLEFMQQLCEKPEGES